ncbi:DUF4386 domain-containing protein [Marinoscillum pacificum]|uniref:DUF4386 domain-containing protein n=1 Tax=Marinoscillum pacificum TaxID=392723 RepID=UPI0021575BAD|nr:DUF4386 domain-containing protein [Marinoscillum pacificum]
MTLTNRKYAIIAGAALMLMAVAAGYAYAFVYSSLIIADDTQQTITNLQQETGMFRNGIIAWGWIFLLDIIVAWSCYKFFQDTNKGLSMMTAIARTVYTIFLGVGILQLVKVMVLLPASDPQEIMFALRSFEVIWSLGLIIFGVHLIGLGKLVLTADFIANIFGWLLLFSGFCYLGIHSAKAVLPSMEEGIAKLEMILSLPMAIGELGFGVWLLIKGGKNN